MGRFRASPATMVCCGCGCRSGSVVMVGMDIKNIVAERCQNVAGRFSPVKLVLAEKCVLHSVLSKICSGITFWAKNSDLTHLAAWPTIALTIFYIEYKKCV